MLARVTSVATIGLTAVEVTVEVDVAEKGFPKFDMVGLPDKAVGEARARVKKAIENTGSIFPDKRITVNLAPADLPKQGSVYDLPIAVGILAATEQIDPKGLVNNYFYGEVGLDGSIKEARGVLLVAMLAKEKGVKAIFVPKLSACEGAVVDQVEVLPVNHLKELIEHIQGGKVITPLQHIEVESTIEELIPTTDFAEIVGQELAKRAAEIAAAGGHNLLLLGPPGAGKTMLAKAFPGILPPLLREESLEVTRIYSVSGMMGVGQAIVRRRPYRSPHHTTSMVAMIGGGSNPMPGEVSLAHLGVLFLDEMPEFPRTVLEVLRQPMEDGMVVISRAAARAEYPAKFMLLASANPCPCGYLNHPTKECVCGERAIAKYRRRISGPILDRIDLHVWVDPVEVSKLGSEMVSEIKRSVNESSAIIRARVLLARERQEKRFAQVKGIYTNAQMGNSQVKKYCSLSTETRDFLAIATKKFELSARAYFKVIKVARTIADLDGSLNITVSHLAEAVQYRENIW